MHRQDELRRYEFDEIWICIALECCLIMKYPNRHMITLDKGVLKPQLGTILSDAKN
jgi:hypothetical protein